MILTHLTAYVGLKTLRRNSRRTFSVLLFAFYSTSGGRNGSDFQVSSVISTSDGASFSEIAELPEPMVSHCLVIVDEDRFAVVGGQYTGNKAYMFDRATG